MDSSARSLSSGYAAVKVSGDLETALQYDGRRQPHSTRRMFATVAGLLLFSAVVGVAAVATARPTTLSTSQLAEKHGLVQKFGFTQLKSFFGVEEDEIDQELSPEMKKHFDAAMKLAKNPKTTVAALKNSTDFTALSEDLQNTVLTAQSDLDTLAPAVMNTTSELDKAKSVLKNETAKVSDEKDKIKKLAANGTDQLQKEAINQTQVKMNQTQDQLEKEKERITKLQGEITDEKKKAKNEFSKLPGLVGGEVGNLGLVANTTSSKCSDRCATEADDDTPCSNPHFINGMCISCNAYRKCCNTHEECDCGCVNNNVDAQASCGSACKTGGPSAKCYWSSPMTCEVFSACFDDVGDGIFREQDLKSTQCVSARKDMDSKPVC